MVNQDLFNTVKNLPILRFEFMKSTVVQSGKFLMNNFENCLRSDTELLKLALASPSYKNVTVNG